MPSSIHRLLGQGRITPPPWLDSNVMLEVVMGSRAYGCNESEESDFDIYGICIPPKRYIFPSTQGLIRGFDNVEEFDQWHEPHVHDQDGKREYDFTVYNIVRFFQLAEQNNPNIIDALFVHETCVKHCTPVGRHILDNRKKFLSKLCWKKFRSYASDQFDKLDRKPEGKRKAIVDKYGYDVKFAYNIIRLMNEAEQIITEGDLNLFIGKEECQAIRRGDWSRERLTKEFLTRKDALETVYAKCKLPERPDHSEIKAMLMECLEMHYGSLAQVCVRPDASTQALRDINRIMASVGHCL